MLFAIGVQRIEEGSCGAPMAAVVPVLSRGAPGQQQRRRPDDDGEDDRELAPSGLARCGLLVAHGVYILQISAGKDTLVLSRTIPNDGLHARNIPEADANWEKIGAFALTFDGYRHWGGFERCAEIAETRDPATLTEARTCLFFEQRRWRHSGYAPDEEALAYHRALLVRIRDLVARMEPRMAEIDRLRDAYLATTYVSRPPSRELRIRIGAEVPQLHDFLAGMPVDSWAFISACNPRSRALPAAENLARHGQLMRELQATGYKFFEGEGVPDASDWPAEPSVLVLGIPPGDAQAVARGYEQHAIVVGHFERPAELMFCLGELA